MVLRWIILCTLLVFVKSNHQPRSHFDKSALKEGRSDLVPGITISGAIIMSDSGDSKQSSSEAGHYRNTTQSDTTTSTAETNPELMLIAARVKNAQSLMNELPFGLTQWPAVFTTLCPHYAHLPKKTERGLALAHYRIWHDFVHFDLELLHRYNQILLSQSNNNSGNASIEVDVSTNNLGRRLQNNNNNDNKGSSIMPNNALDRVQTSRTSHGGRNKTRKSFNNNNNNSTSSHTLYTTYGDPNFLVSNDGNFAINMTSQIKYKYNQTYSDNDIIVIFEDDAESAIIDTNITVIEELAMMKVDLLFLGWCDGRLARPVPLCAHAYAITRAGARKLIEHYEPCGKAIDEQFVIFAKNNWITYRTAHGFSYKNLNSNYPVHGDKTYGIFHQKKKTLGSINGNRRRQRRRRALV